MKVTYTTLDGRFTAEFEGDQSTIFEDIAQFDEIFGNLVCSNGKESSDKVTLRVRTDKEENKYYEAVCTDDEKPALRFARRRYGQHKKGGGLFPKDGGAWFKWNGTEEVPLVPKKGGAKKDEKSGDTGEEKTKDKVPF